MLSFCLALDVLKPANPASEFQKRRDDWRCGPVVYQVFVDRFAPSSHLESKRKLYQSPRTLKKWTDLPVPGKLLPDKGVWSHELGFWGGDLKSVRSKLDYVKSLGDVLYLTPIFDALTNHKYDTRDYFKIAPEFGTHEDFKSLLAGAHQKALKVMLDGVFNHVGRTNPFFQSAQSNLKASHRNWFYFDKVKPQAYRGWAGVANLPALRLENLDVRNYLWKSPDSVVRKYLREGIDGWRLDVGFELGPKFLGELTHSAHIESPGSWIVGEISGYPAGWFPAVDGVFNFFSPNLIGKAMRGEMSGSQVGKALQDVVSDAGIQNLLHSWILLDNHDTPRFASTWPEFADRKLLWASLFTLPGSPVIYYGSELGMEGSGDPQARAPMRWDLANSKNPDLAWVKKLISIRKRLRSLQIGDFSVLATQRLIAYARTTDRLKEMAIVVINPTDEKVLESFPTRVGKLMSWGDLTDVLTGERVKSFNGFLEIACPPRSVRILTPVLDRRGGYSPYDRVDRR
jgi:cyclomaltodextrinase